MQLTREADREVADPQHGAPARMPRRVVARGDPQLDACGLPHEPGGLDGVGPGRRTTAPPPSAGFPVTGQYHADVQRLGGQRGGDLRDLGVGRTSGDARLGHRELLAVRQHDLADREQREIARAP